jgi:hypothetical protein
MTKSAAKFAALILIPALTVFAVAKAAAAEPYFSYRLQKDFEQPRGLFWRPILSLLVPGLDQWFEEQYRSASVYSGYATLGFGAQLSALDFNNSGNNTFSEDNDRHRRYIWGTQAYMDIGFVSAFHSFRKAAETRKRDGQFLFLKHEETAGDLFMAPFHLEKIIKPSVFIPLAALSAFEVVLSNQPRYRRGVWRGDDLTFATAMSANAGIGEEALFRGYFMPVTREWWGSDFWSNTATATVFAAAHLRTVSVPLPQFALGWYLGWHVQRNEWQLSDAVFIHTWWDIVAISAELARNRGQAVYLPVFKSEF